VDLERPAPRCPPWLPRTDGARVLHPACIELGRQKGVAIHAASTFGEDRFTRIRCEESLAFTEHAREKLSIVGVTSRKSRVHLHARSQNAALFARDAPGAIHRAGGAIFGRVILARSMTSPDNIISSAKTAVSCADMP